MKARCYFPQTMTPEYDAIKKVGQCKDVSLPPMSHDEQNEKHSRTCTFTLYFALYCVTVFVFHFFFIEIISATSGQSQVHASNRLACATASSHQCQTAE